MLIIVVTAVLFCIAYLFARIFILHYKPYERKDITGAATEKKLGCQKCRFVARKMNLCQNIFIFFDFSFFFILR